MAASVTQIRTLIAEAIVRDSTAEGIDSVIANLNRVPKEAAEVTGSVASEFDSLGSLIEGSAKKVDAIIRRSLTRPEQELVKLLQEKATITQAMAGSIEEVERLSPVLERINNRISETQEQIKALGETKVDRAFVELSDWLKQLESVDLSDVARETERWAEEQAKINQLVADNQARLEREPELLGRINAAREAAYQQHLANLEAIRAAEAESRTREFAPVQRRIESYRAEGLTEAEKAARAYTQVQEDLAKAIERGAVEQTEANAILARYSQQLDEVNAKVKVRQDAEKARAFESFRRVEITTLPEVDRVAIQQQEQLEKFRRDAEAAGVPTERLARGVAALQAQFESVNKTLRDQKFETISRETSRLAEAFTKLEQRTLTPLEREMQQYANAVREVSEVQDAAIVAPDRVRVVLERLSKTHQENVRSLTQHKQAWGSLDEVLRGSNIEAWVTSVEQIKLGPIEAETQRWAEELQRINQLIEENQSKLEREPELQARAAAARDASYQRHLDNLARLEKVQKEAQEREFAPVARRIETYRVEGTTDVEKALRTLRQVEDDLTEAVRRGKVEQTEATAILDRYKAKVTEVSEAVRARNSVEQQKALKSFETIEATTLTDSERALKNQAETLNDLRVAAEKAAIPLERLAQAEAKLKAQFAISNAASQVKAQQEAARETEKLTSVFEKYRRATLDPVTRATEEYNDKLRELRLVSDAGVVSQERMSVVLNKLRKQHEENIQALTGHSNRWGTFGRVLQGVEDRVSVIARGFTSLRSILAGLGVGFLITGFLETRAEMDRLVAQIRVFSDSSSVANDVFEGLTKVAQENAATIRNTVEAYTVLRSRGLEPTMDDMTRLVDIANATAQTVPEVAESVVAAAAGRSDALRKLGLLVGQEGELVRLTYKNLSVVATRDSRSILDAITTLRVDTVGASQEIRNTTAGTLTELSNEWLRFKTTVTEGGLSDALRSIVDRIQELNTASGTTAQEIGQNLGGAARVAADAFIFLLQHLDDLTNVALPALLARLGALAGPWGALAGLVTGVVANYAIGAGSIQESVDKTEDALKRVAAGFDSASVSGKSFGEAQKEIGTELAAQIQAYENQVAILQGEVNEKQERLKLKYEPKADTTVYQAVSNAAQVEVDKITNYIDNAATAVAQFFGSDAVFGSVNRLKLYNEQLAKTQEAYEQITRLKPFDAVTGNLSTAQRIEFTVVGNVRTELQAISAELQEFQDTRGVIPPITIELDEQALPTIETLKEQLAELAKQGRIELSTLTDADVQLLLEEKLRTAEVPVKFTINEDANLDQIEAALAEVVSRVGDVGPEVADKLNKSLEQIRSLQNFDVVVNVKSGTSIDQLEKFLKDKSTKDVELRLSENTSKTLLEKTITDGGKVIINVSATGDAAAKDVAETLDKITDRNALVSIETRGLAELKKVSDALQLIGGKFVVEIAPSVPNEARTLITEIEQDLESLSARAKGINLSPSIENLRAYATEQETVLKGIPGAWEAVQEALTSTEVRYKSLTAQVEAYGEARRIAEAVKQVTTTTNQSTSLVEALKVSKTDYENLKRVFDIQNQIPGISTKQAQALSRVVEQNEKNNLFIEDSLKLERERLELLDEQQKRAKEVWQTPGINAGDATTQAIDDTIEAWIRGNESAGDVFKKALRDGANQFKVDIAKAILDPFKQAASLWVKSTVNSLLGFPTQGASTSASLGLVQGFISNGSYGNYGNPGAAPGFAGGWIQGVGSGQVPTAPSSGGIGQLAGLAGLAQGGLGGIIGGLETLSIQLGSGAANIAYNLGLGAGASNVIGDLAAGAPYGIIGSMGAGMLANAVGLKNNKTNAAVGGTIGTIAGTLLGPPIIGPLIGGALGNLAGGLLGPSQPTNARASLAFDPATGATSALWHAAKGNSAENLELLKGMVDGLEQYTSAVKDLGIEFDSKITQINFGNRDKTQFNVFDNETQTERVVNLQTVRDVEDLANNIFTELLKDAKASSENLQAILDAGIKDPEALVNLLGVFKALEDEVASLTAITTPAEKALKEVTSTLSGLGLEASKQADLLARATDLIAETTIRGWERELLEIENPLSAQLEDLLNVWAGRLADVQRFGGQGQDLAEALNQAELDQFIANATAASGSITDLARVFQDLVDAFNRAGKDLTPVIEAFKNAQQGMAEAFDTDVATKLLQITAPERAKLKAELEAEKTLLEEASRRGANMVAAQRLAALQREAFFNSLTDDEKLKIGEFLGEVENYVGALGVALGQFRDVVQDNIDKLEQNRQAIIDNIAVWDTFINGIKDTADGLRAEYFPGSPIEKLDYLRTRAATLGEEALAGDPVAQENYTQAVRDVIEASRDLYGSTPDFINDLNTQLSNLDSVQGEAEEQRSDLQRQLDTADQQLEVSKNILDTLNQPDPALDYLQTQIAAIEQTNQLMKELGDKVVTLSRLALTEDSKLTQDLISRDLYSLLGITAPDISGPTTINTNSDVGGYTAPLSASTNALDLSSVNSALQEQTEVIDVGNLKIVEAVEEVRDEVKRLVTVLGLD